MSVKGNIYRKLSPLEAADVVEEARTKLISMDDLPTGLTEGFLWSVQTAIAQRNRSGLPVDYTSGEEVVGLVSAAMGGYDHMTSARIALNRYVAGIVQTGDDIEDILGSAQAQQGLAGGNDATEI